MLSGEFSTIRIEDITVNRNARIRRTLTSEAVNEMAESLRQRGLIHPIVLDRSHTLVAGETRLEGARRIGWDRIPFQYADALTENELLSIELEENVKRRDLDWKDKCDAMLRFHKLQQDSQKKWTLDDTAKAIGYSKISVSDMLSVAKEVVKGNPMVVAASKYSVARSIVSRAKQRQEADIISNINSLELPKESKEIIVADFNEWAPKYSGVPFNFLHVDFPYGIGHDKSAQGNTAAYGVYKDSEEVYWTLLNTLIENRESLLGQSAHLIFWFSMNHYAKTLSVLSEHFRVDPHPLVWFKSDNTGILPDYTRGPRRVYETAFFCSWGDRKIIQAVANLFPCPVEKRSGHASEKAEAMLKHFFRMAVDEGTRMLDPTAGSGSALRAAKASGAASILGLEINEEFVEGARRELQ